MTTIKGGEEFQKALAEVMKKCDTPAARRLVLEYSDRFVLFLNEVQSMPMRERLYYWECAFLVVDLLRQNGQLGQTESEIDGDVKRFLSDTISNIRFLYDGHADR